MDMGGYRMRIGRVRRIILYMDNKYYIMRRNMKCGIRKQDGMNYDFANECGGIMTEILRG